MYIHIINHETVQTDTATILRFSFFFESNLNRRRCYLAPEPPHCKLICVCLAVLGKMFI